MITYKKMKAVTLISFKPPRDIGKN